jgi:hypothetical protein
MPDALRQPTRASAPSPSFGDGRQGAEVEQALWWTVLQPDLHCRSRDVLAKAAQHQMWPRVTRRQINRWRAKWPLRRGKGRPPRAAADGAMRSGKAVVGVTPRLALVGGPLFACWLEQHEAFEPVVAGLTEAISAHHRTHPGEDFALWHPRDATLRRRLQALVLAPW